MAELPTVIDLAQARLDRLRRKAAPIGIEVRRAGHEFSLYGPDRGLFLHRTGVGRIARWLTYDEAAKALDAHLAAPDSAIRR